MREHPARRGPATPITAVILGDGRLAPPPSRRFNQQLVPLPDGRVLSIGGLRESSVAAEKDTEEVFAPAIGWRRVAPTKVRRVLPVAAALADGSVLVLGLAEPSGNSNRVERFEPTTNTWSDLPDLEVGLWNPSITALRTGQLLVAGGIRAEFDENKERPLLASVYMWTP